MCTVADYGWIRWILHFYNKDDRIQDGGVRYCKQQSNIATVQHGEKILLYTII
jgi:hypothetical protein